MTVQSILYGEADFYNPSSATSQLLIDAGIDTYVYFTLHVNESGDIGAHGGTLVEYDTSTNTSTYKGPSDWPSNLVALKNNGIQIFFCVGAAPSPKSTSGIYQKIHDNMPTSTVSINGVSTTVYDVPTSSDNNPLFANFAELYNTFTYTESDGSTGYLIDGIVFDNEDFYSSSLMVTFARMLNSIGYANISFCPYEEMSTWMDTAKYLIKGNTSAVAGSVPLVTTGGSFSSIGLSVGAALPNAFYNMHLQCYSGGSPNKASTWINHLQSNKIGLSSSVAEAAIVPGYYLSTETAKNVTSATVICPDAFETVFSNLQSGGTNSEPGKSTTGIGLSGGFIYNYSIFRANQGLSGTNCTESLTLANYVNALSKGLGG